MDVASKHVFLQKENGVQIFSPLHQAISGNKAMGVWGPSLSTYQCTPHCPTNTAETHSGGWIYAHLGALVPSQALFPTDIIDLMSAWEKELHGEGEVVRREHLVLEKSNEGV